MATNTLNAPATNTNPFVAAVYFVPTGASTIKSVGSTFQANGTNSIFCDSTNIDSSDVIWSHVNIGLTSSTDSAGPCFVNSAGDGFQAIANGTNTRLFTCTAGVLGGSVLATRGGDPADNTIVSLKLTKSTKRFEIYYNMVLQGLVFDYLGSIPANLRGGLCMRGAGQTKQLVVEWTPANTVVSINGGADITQGQTGIGAVLTGFGGAITSIPTDQAGIATSGIAGSTNAPTFNISGWAEGQPYPILPVETSFTFTRSGESAAGTETVNYPAGWAKITFSAPVIDDSNFIGKWIADQGHTVDGGEYYNQSYGDLVVGADSGVEVTNGGTFPSWFRPVSGATAGNMYFFQVTVTDGGAVVVVTSGLKGESIKASAIRAKKIKSSKFF